MHKTEVKKQDPLRIIPASKEYLRKLKERHKEVEKVEEERLRQYGDVW